MPSHLSSLGFVVAADADLLALAHRLGPAADPVDTPAGTYFRAADPASGAELWLHASADGDEFYGAVPHLAGPGRARVTLAGRVTAADGGPLEGAFRGVANGLPVLFDAPDFRRFDRLPLPADVWVQLCGFAHEAEGFADVAAFEATADGELKPAVRSLIAVGLLDSGPPRPLAFVAGVVTASGWRVSALTGGRFGAIELDTAVGLVAVALDPAVLAELPPAGGVLAGTVWLSGRLVG